MPWLLIEKHMKTVIMPVYTSLKSKFSFRKLTTMATLRGLKLTRDVKRYADQAAVEAHMKLRHVQELLIRLKSSVSQEPEVWMLDQCEGLDFTRATATAHPDPFIVFTELEYKPGTAKSTMPYWEAIFKSTRDEEQGALLWELAKDERHGDRLFAIHTYESRSYLMDVHAASQAVQNSLSHGRDNQIGIKVHFLKLLGGYLNRE
jgi:quinol monooxygenase YgiN